MFGAGLVPEQVFVASILFKGYRLCRRPPEELEQIILCFQSILYGIIIIAPEKNSHLVGSVWQASMANK